ncbi:MAG: glycosyltransferase family 2 protein [Planctomycetota bacterium JB042]
MSIVVPVRDNVELTGLCAEALFLHTDAPVELVLVDNGSGPEVEELARSLARRHAVRHLRNERNEGFGFASNQGMAAATGDRVVLMNNDVIVTPGWYERLSEALERSDDIGMVGPRSNRVSGPQLVPGAAYRDRASLDQFATRLAREAAGEAVDLARLVALCVLLRREVMTQVGGFDPCFWLGNFEDDDLSMRILRKGWRLVMANDAFVHHEGSATFRRERFDWDALMEENWRWFRAKHGYDGPMTAPYPARELATRVPFDARRDFVPLEHGRVFRPDAPPMHLPVSEGPRTLLFAEPRGDSWARALLTWLVEHRGAPERTLVLRVEPHLPEVVDALRRRTERLFAAVGGTDLPDVVLECTPLAPAERGGLYTAVSEVLLSGSPRDPLHAREAASCGVPVSEAAPVAVP